MGSYSERGDISGVETGLDWDPEIANLSVKGVSRTA